MKLLPAAILYIHPVVAFIALNVAAKGDGDARGKQRTETGRVLPFRRSLKPLNVRGAESSQGNVEESARSCFSKATQRFSSGMLSLILRATIDVAFPAEV